MDGQAIRAMLTQHLERLKYQLFMRDQEKDGEWSNLFVEAMVRKSEGLPLYVQMALEDLREGKLTTQDEEQLPEGLQAYFEQILDRLRIADVGAVLTPIFCLLAWAKEPLTEKALKVLLSTHDLSQDRDWNLLFHKAMDQAHLMLLRRVNMSGEWGWTIYHESFRQHVLTTGAVKVYRRQCQKRWLEVCSQWQSLLEDSLRRYALRHYAKHLYEAERYEDLYSLAGNESFLREQVLVLADEPHAPLNTIQSALDAATAADNAAIMADLSIAHARLVLTIRQESPLDALRAGSLNRAWDLADLYDIERGVLWYLLLACELKDDGKIEDARCTLIRLLKKAPPRLSFWPNRAAHFLLVGIFEISSSLFTELYEHLIDDFQLSFLFEKLAIHHNPAIALELVQNFEDDNKKASVLGGIASAQVKAGNFEGAIETAKYSSADWTLGWTLNKIAVEQAKTNKLAKAIETAFSIDHPNAQSSAFREILETVEETRGQSNKREDCDAVIRIAPQILDANKGENQEIAKALNKMLLSLIRSGDFDVVELPALLDQCAPWIDEKTLGTIAEVLAKGGNFTAAIGTAQLIGESSRLIGQIYLRHRVLKTIAELQIEVNDFDAALATAHLIGEMPLNPWGLSVIAGVQARAGETAKSSQNFATAIQLAIKNNDTLSLSLMTVAKSKMRDEIEVARAISAAVEVTQATNNDFRFADISEALAQVGEFGAAVDSARLLNSAGMITMTLQTIAEIQIGAGDEAGIWKTLSAAIDAANQQSDDKEKNRDRWKIITTLGEQAKSEVKAGNLDLVLEKTMQIDDESLREHTLGAIVEVLSKMGNFSDAIRTANKQWHRTNSFYTIAQAQAEMGDYARAREIFAMTLGSVADDNMGAWLDRALKEITIVKMETNEFAAAIKIALSIPNVRVRAECLRTIGTTQAKTGALTQAHETLAIAFETAQGITDIEMQLREVSKIVLALAEMGELNEARNKLAVLADAVHQVRIPWQWLHEWDREMIAEDLCRVAWEQVRTNDCIAAIETARLIGKVEYGDQVLSELLRALVEYATERAEVGEVIESRKILMAAIEMLQFLCGESQRTLLIKGIAAALAKAGDVNDAIETSRLTNDENEYAQTLGDVALIQAMKGEIVAARKTFTTALNTAQQIKNIGERAECLTFIASAQAKAGEAACASKTFASAIDAALLISEVGERSRSSWSFKDTEEALHTITRRQSEAGEFVAAIETSNLIGDTTKRIWSLCAVAVAQAKVERDISARASFARAHDAAKTISDIEELDRSLRHISKAQTEAGELVDAIDTARLINGSENLAATLRIISEAHAETGKFTTALEIAAQIGEANERAECLMTIASAQAKAGDVVRAQETFATAIDVALQLNKSTKKSYRRRGPVEILLAIAVSQSEAGTVEAAHETFDIIIELAQQISAKNEQVRCLSEIVEAQTTSGDLIGAIKTAWLIGEAESRSRAFKYIATTQLWNGNLLGIQEAFNAAVESAKQIKDAEKRTQELSEIAVEQAKARIGEQAVQTAEAILTQRNLHLPQIADALTQIADLHNFKRLLIPCAYYLDAAYAMCGLLGRMYPQSADVIAEDLLIHSL